LKIFGWLEQIIKKEKQMIEANDVGDVKEVLEDNQHVLIDFSAEWCGPCKAMLPILLELEQKYTDVVFVKVDTDMASSVMSEYEISSLPTIKLFTYGQEVGSWTGSINRETIINMLEIL
jgi:thioredoxin 1